MDFDELVAFLDGQLRLGVLLAEENQILNAGPAGARRGRTALGEPTQGELAWSAIRAGLGERTLGSRWT